MKNRHHLLPLAAMSGLLLAAPANAAVVVLLSDDFTSADNTDLNLNLAARQDGTLEATGGAAPTGSTWTELVGTSNAISTNRLNVPSSGHVRNNANLAPALTSVDLVGTTGFSVSFKMQSTGTLTNWTSAYLTTHPGDERGNSRCGIIAFNNGDLQIYGDGGADGTGLSNANLITKLGSWSITTQNSYSLIASRTTATTGTYDLFINNIEVYSNRAYTLGSGGDYSGLSGEYNFEIINVANGAGIYDDLLIATIPEPSAALLGGIGMLILLRRRR